MLVLAADVLDLSSTSLTRRRSCGSFARYALARGRQRMTPANSSALTVGLAPPAPSGSPSSARIASTISASAVAPSASPNAREELLREADRWPGGRDRVDDLAVGQLRGSSGSPGQVAWGTTTSRGGAATRVGRPAGRGSARSLTTSERHPPLALRRRFEALDPSL